MLSCPRCPVPESGVWYVCDILYAALYVSVRSFVGRGCAVLRMYINVCNYDMLCC